MWVNYFRKYSFQDSNKNALQAKHKTCSEVVYQLLPIWCDNPTSRMWNKASLASCPNFFGGGEGGDGTELGVP